MIEAGAEPPAAGPPAGSELVPGWLVRLAAVGWRLLVATALGLVLIYICVVLSTVTASILVAAIVAATFAPYVLALRNRGWSRIKAAAAVFLVAAAVIIATLVLIAVAFLPYVQEVLASLSAGIAAVKAELAAVSVPEGVGLVLERVAKHIEAAVGASLGGIAGDVGTVATVGILGTFLTFFFMMDGDKAWVWALSSANTWRRDEITSSGHVALERVGGYLRGTAVIAAIYALAEGLFLVLLGVPLAGPLAVIVFFGRFIPYVGSLLTSVLVLSVTLATQGSTDALILLILISILSFITGKFLTPVIYHRTVDIHPALALIALPAGYALGGIIGLFIAIPVVAFVLATSRAIISILGIAPEPRSPGADQIVPVWLDRLGQLSWRSLVVLALLAVVIQAAVQVPIVVLPVTLGVVLAATLAPLSKSLERRGWSRGRAALAATLGATFAVTAIIVLTAASLASGMEGIVSQADAGATTAETSTTGQAGALVQFVHAYGAGTLKAVADAISSLGGIAIVILLSILLTFYAMRDGPEAWARFLKRFEPGRRSYIGAAGGRAFSVLGGYMLGTSAISLFGAVSQFAIMTILGLPFALPLAVLAFFGGFIPYIGSLITTGLAFLVAVATGSDTDVLIMGIYTIVFNIIQGNFVAPIVYSRVVSLHPAVVLVAIPAGNEVAGIIGMFLVVPFLGVVATTWRTVLRVLDTEDVPPLETPPPELAIPETSLASAATD
jgi:putative heme transporter